MKMHNPEHAPRPPGMATPPKHDERDPQLNRKQRRASKAKKTKSKTGADVARLKRENDALKRLCLAQAHSLAEARRELRGRLACSQALERALREEAALVPIDQKQIDQKLDAMIKSAEEIGEAARAPQPDDHKVDPNLRINGLPAPTVEIVPRATEPKADT